MKKISIYNPNQLFNNLLLSGSLNLFIENLLRKNFNLEIFYLDLLKPLKLNKIIDIVSNYFDVKNNINWKSNKNMGFYLDIRRAINLYNFKPCTKKSILNYLNKNYPKHV